MKPQPIERRVAQGRRRLQILRERAAREGLPDDPLLTKALDDVADTVESLADSLDDLSTTNEELARSNFAAASSARRFEELFKFAPDAYIVTDERGVIHELNGMAELLVGRARHLLVGKPLVTLVAPVDADRFLDGLAGIRQRGLVLDDHLLRFGANPGFDASISARPQAGAAGVEIFWMLRDVTERQHAERALRASDARTRAVLDAAFDGMLSTDAVGVIRASNTALRSMFGYPVDSLEGQMVDVLGLTRETLAPGCGPTVREATGVRRDGSKFPIQISVAEAPAESGPIVSSVRDLSVQKGLESRLQAATAATAMAEERERQRLAADLHDDIGQLLSLAGMKLGMLRNAHDDAAEQLRAEVAELVTRAHQRTESLTFQLSPPILRDLGLAAAVEWLAEDIGKSYGLRVHVEHDGEPSLDEGTRISLFRSLRELLINAARHSHSKSASAKMARRDQQLEVEVEDRGVGFEVGSGSQGFGLLYARERVESLGGRFEIESQPGGGTRAKLAVALAPPASAVRKGVGHSPAKSRDKNR